MTHARRILASKGAPHIRRLAAAALAMLTAACAAQHAELDTESRVAGSGGSIGEHSAGAARRPEFGTPTSELCPQTVRLVTSDPPRDEVAPARTRQLAIPSGPALPRLGRPAEMNALMLQAAGPGPHPTMLLLHGLPGGERNADLAQAARRGGWNVLTFAYRGAWGSEGTFSIQHAVADAQAALAFLRSQDAAREYSVDPNMVVLAGHGMGGYLAAHVTVEDGRSVDISSAPPNRFAENPVVGRAAIKGVVMIDPWDLAATARELKAGGAEARARFIASLDDLGRALGPITADDIADNLIRRGEEWSLPAIAEPLSRRVPFLMLSAIRGNSEDSRSFLAARTRGCPSFSCHGFFAAEIPTDHAFSDWRMDLAVEVVAWLRQMARKPC